MRPIHVAKYRANVIVLSLESTLPASISRLFIRIREIRRPALRCALHARGVLLPAALGTGLALGGAGCGGARTVQVDGGLVADTTAPPVAPVYADPFPEPELDAAADAVAPPVLPEYGTPFPGDPPVAAAPTRFRPSRRPTARRFPASTVVRWTPSWTAR